MQSAALPPDVRKGCAFPHIGGHSPKEFHWLDLIFKDD
jgi:hypothetical protein